MQVFGVPVTTAYPCDSKPQPTDKLRAVLPRQKQTKEKTKTKSHLYKNGNNKKKKEKKNFESIVSLRVRNSNNEHINHTMKLWA